MLDGWALPVKEEALWVGERGAVETSRQSLARRDLGVLGAVRPRNFQSFYIEIPCRRGNREMAFIGCSQAGRQKFILYVLRVEIFCWSS